MLRSQWQTRTRTRTRSIRIRAEGSRNSSELARARSPVHPRSGTDDTADLIRAHTRAALSVSFAIRHSPRPYWSVPLLCPSLVFARGFRCACTCAGALRIQRPARHLPNVRGWGVREGGAGSADKLSFWTPPFPYFPPPPGQARSEPLAAG